jgi:adenylosuccinate synthase
MRTVADVPQLDVLDGLAELRIATAYHVDGAPLAGFPADLDLLARVDVQYATLPGWQTSIEKVRSYGDLPENCRRYVEWIEDALGVPVEWIGVGPGREAMVRKEPGLRTVAREGK